ncbi:MAG TPA: cyclase family protein [Candidatus Brocadiia bacterium]|nr:cyclase family protein [Candidatus Brocadiia bacterium]
MRVIDLTRSITFPAAVADKRDYNIPLSIRGEKYTALCHRFDMDGMSGTYIDFPGHIAEFDNGQHAGNAPLEDLFVLDGTVIHLDRKGRGREVTAEELRATGVKVKGQALLIHALGHQDCAQVDEATIPYFGPSAIQWIVSHPLRLFASDIYEKRPDLQGVFPELFRRGVCTVCMPANLDQLTQTYVRFCAIPARMEGVVQAPCRFFAVEG